MHSSTVLLLSCHSSEYAFAFFGTQMEKISTGDPLEGMSRLHCSGGFKVGVVASVCWYVMCDV